MLAWAAMVACSGPALADDPKGDLQAADSQAADPQAADPQAADPQAGDPAAGKKVFRKCMACHQLGPEAIHKIGPVLNGVLGRTAGSITDFTYSPAMKKAGENGIVWSAETIAAYLASPREYVAGNKMAFVGLRRPKQRDDVIAYLKSFKADGSTAGDGE